MNQELISKVKLLLPKPLEFKDGYKLFGEASYREYYRIQTQSTQGLILMKIPAGKQSVSEEITNYQGPKNDLPFLNIAQYLKKASIPVPEIVAINLKEGLILLQDLGDQSLEKLVLDQNEPMKLSFYKRVIDLLLEFQKAGSQSASPECMAFQRSFDAHLLEWEFEHFLEYGIEDRHKLKIPNQDRQVFIQEGKKLVSDIMQIPQGLTHRDFQSRNLLLYHYQFYLIDFQDALLGPPQYDLVALLRDSYIQLSSNSLEALVNYYLNGRDKHGLAKLEPKNFWNDFHLMTIQRKLKDAGRFQFIHTVKGNSKFLSHVPLSLTYVNEALKKLPNFQKLQTLLIKYVPEIH